MEASDGHGTDSHGTLRADAVIRGRAGLDALIEVLAGQGYRVRGPVVRDGVVMVGEISSTADLPIGVHDRQAPGSYHLDRDGGDSIFAWAVGPQSWKADLLPPRSLVWEALEGDPLRLVEPAEDGNGGGRGHRVALLGARPCDLAAIAVLGTVLEGGPVPDPAFRARRRDLLVVAVECGSPDGTCFCASMGTGPAASARFDLCLTELGAGGDHRFLVRVGSDKGAGVLQHLDAVPARPEDYDERGALIESATERMGRSLDTAGLAGDLAAVQTTAEWSEIAERCLACGNCTMVCPTCFCTSFSDTTDVAGAMLRERRWASCFEAGHSYIHGGPVRKSREARYRQWLTHKLSTWNDQFGEPGCVGCGRCIAWCPVGIDITVEASALRARRKDGR